jgi:hypothetical protein
VEGGRTSRTYGIRSSSPFALAWLAAGGWWLVAAVAAVAAVAYLPVARRQAELGKFRTRCLFEAQRLLPYLGGHGVATQPSRPQVI